ncbi:hydrogenase expression/formation protein HypE [Desulforhabdus amnigena]|jgi:hydrogenase expression/formation protein HypE|uniref:Hydrogenase expression/formation protein HypE n=1 Tax=Desulforhabdus amnigena TaxID=40218 RepID=A0A9W6D3K9_9BACT|nr:hydrogenase expression/formation protein HypE [Desulforhabdus amnigena]NLJ26883.1 hydrogenase expression/formation protein HypE [Deltaproteobacteria bacterium]GLI33938.1 hydrogenase expression/formation protein HypE [Desulforhabdus amnigena]
MESMTVQLDQGSGGRATHELVQDLFIQSFRNEYLLEMNDSALVNVGNGQIAMTTDSYVVDPVIFPGGNIGSLAVHGTVNDLAMRGARPLYMTAGFILEEGLSLETLGEIVSSMAAAAREANVFIVAGDTKVVPRGKADKIFINTSGVGVVPPGVRVGGQYAEPGDAVLINGTIGDHGMAVLCKREGLAFENEIRSDSASLNGLVEKMLEVCPQIHVLRDPTRGGVATTLNEIAEQSHVGIRLEEEALPVREDVAGACEILGLDPLYVANEGKVLVFVPARCMKSVLRVMRDHPLGRNACKIGETVSNDAGRVFLRTRIGGHRLLDMLRGEQLPRIC